ncbi:hypothetical protein P3S68_023615 [Capsicum galapagoense]
MIDDTSFIKSHLRKSSADISGQKILLFENVEGELSRDYSINVLSTEASISADSKVVLLDQLSADSKVVLLNQLSVPEFCGKVSCLEPHLLQRGPIWPRFVLAYDFVSEDYKFH